MTQRVRLDELLVRRGLAENLHDAQAAVLAGEVVVGDHRQTSVGLRVREDVPLRVKAGKEHRQMGYVSRGGGKLAAALQQFGLDVSGLRCADLGCSTGGFTDCLLKHGAAHVSAIDVGRADFDWRLRNDPRVSLFERTNVRGIDAHAVGGPFELVVADLSFISITRVLADVAGLLAFGALFVSLVKPQFEVAKDAVGARGVVYDASQHREVLMRVVSALPAHGMSARALGYSPVKGPAGNIEFLLMAASDDAARHVGDEDIRRVVDEAHRVVGGQT